MAFTRLSYLAESLTYFMLLGSCNTSLPDHEALKSSSYGVTSKTQQPPAAIAPDHRSQTGFRPDGQIIWAHGFAGSSWLDPWQPQAHGAWGLDNFEVVRTPEGPFSQVLRVHYPAGSASPAIARSHHAPLGGGEFRARLGMVPRDALQLSYYVRFSDDFNFVRGGKLPGLFGGTANSGGSIPNGRDGFSTRLMWREQGEGEVYAYLPTSDAFGTSIGRGAWQFVPGQWHHVTQEVTLNHPHQRDGRIRIWFDGQIVLDQKDLVFRSVDRLKIDGIFFSTFFGGGDPSWATPQTVYADFAEFSVTEVHQD